MGWKSTYTIDRKTAQQVLAAHIITASDRELADMLEQLQLSHFRNYSIVDKVPENEREDDKVIRSVDEFSWK